MHKRGEHKKKLKINKHSVLSRQLADKRNETLHLQRARGETEGKKKNCMQFEEKHIKKETMWFSGFISCHWKSQDKNCFKPWGDFFSISTGKKNEKIDIIMGMLFFAVILTVFTSRSEARGNQIKKYRTRKFQLECVT